MLLLAACGATMAADPPTLSSATTMEEAGMVDMRAVVPGIAQDIRYFGSDNFVGAPVDGYEAPRCYLKREAADALAKVEAALRERHQRLRIFDCYRPARAVAHFMRWVEDGADQRTKATHYPDLGKAQLVGEYISPMSGHSRGATVDLTLDEWRQRPTKLALRCLDLDDVRTEVREHLGTHRSRRYLGEVDDADAAQRQGMVHWRT